MIAVFLFLSLKPSKQDIYLWKIAQVYISNCGIGARLKVGEHASFEGLPANSGFNLGPACLVCYPC